ncbi:MAG: hypothetical protein HY738_21475 [Bacteroidia bacterium]|nr:hypothetical protein [Bacteroidia bacterium]
MKQLRPDYLIDDSSINDKYPSLKFTDKDEDNTLIYFLDENGYCKYCKLMLASGQAKYVVDTLSRKYKYIDTLTWEDNRSKKPSIIKMKNSDWYFTLIITEK